MIRLKEIEHLHEHNGHMVASIYMPLERVWPASAQNQILIKNLMREAERQLAEYYDAATVDCIIQQAELAQNELDLIHPESEGIAIFAGQDKGQVVQLPFTPAQQVVVDNHYHTRGVMEAIFRAPHYLLCTMSKHHTRLFRGAGKNIREVVEKDFPYDHPEIMRTEPTTRLTRQDLDYEKLEDDHAYVRDVAEGLFTILKSENTPLFVMGEAEAVSFLKNHSKVGRYISGELIEDESYQEPKEILDQAYPAIEAYFDKQKEEALAMLAELVGYGRSAHGIQDVWQALVKGQAMTLMIEENFTCPANLGDSEVELRIHDGNPADAKYSDAVDEIIHMALRTNVNLLFYPDGRLTQHNGIAAMLRYPEVAEEAS